MRPIIVINDSTSNGGRVVEGSSSTFIGGQAIARLGDRVVCLHGECRIASGDNTVQVDGIPVARDGDLTNCGARLIAAQLDTGIL